MSQPNTPLLKLETISKKFFGSTVLENINFDLYPGEVHAIFGQNGAGKSTLIQIVTGDIQPSSGKIILNKEELKIHSVHKARELGISAVFQEFSLVPQLTVEENLFLGSNTSKGFFLNKKKLHQMACQTLEQLEFSIKAVVGRMILFPSHLDHYVTENRSNEPRISLAFNCYSSQLPNTTGNEEYDVHRFFA